ncbi:hypothetical protein [Belnapia rosea]|uniref:hypothetical protein n=1 Tax=Belnapia rosea TaxID=938405 RepID=UPI0008914BEF|nr:hypothetical protein [Belnapia rosea]SDB42749.1 hypothetical protein SAMN02927895_01491 [Belnapia rosea]
MIRRRALVLSSLALLLAPAAAAQEPPARFIELQPMEGRAAVRLNALQVVRIARLDGATILDTTAYVQQRSSEALEAVVRRLQSAGLRLVALTDLNGARTYLALDRIVLVRPSEERHAAGARAAIVVAGLRFATDVAVRETVAEAMAAIAAAP